MSAAATHDPSSPLTPGYKLDRYELLCPIAEGGMASVWVARLRGKHGFEKLVAIKTILPRFASDLRFQQMFLDEARLASRIEHINVAQILDLGEEHDVLYLAMEYIDGEALSKLNRACIKRGIQIPPGIVLRILADACAGLHEAHELKDPSGSLLGVVHRDVSPHNILVSSKGVAKLIDFGIAKARDRAGDETNAGVLKGKIQYMAPEQALGRPVDRRADVWAIGAILYHLMSGKPPYEGENQLATLHLLSSGRPPLPLASSVHPAIVAIVRRALTHTPASRFETAAEMREAIERAMDEACVLTSAQDVAAFAKQHLSDRADKRRHAIDVALEAAAERRRVEDLLRPQSDRSSTGVTGEPTSGRASLPGSQAQTSPTLPSAMALSADVAALTPRPSGNAPSYATLGSAAVESSAQFPQVPRSRVPMMAMLGAAAAALVVIAIVVLALVRPTQKGHAVSPLSPPPIAATAASISIPPPAGTAPGGDIPVLSLSDLPKVPTPTPAVIPTPTVIPTASSSASPRPPRKKTIDDGF